MWRWNKEQFKILQTIAIVCFQQACCLCVVQCVWPLIVREEQRHRSATSFVSTIAWCFTCDRRRLLIRTQIGCPLWRPGKNMSFYLSVCFYVVLIYFLYFPFSMYLFHYYDIKLPCKNIFIIFVCQHIIYQTINRRIIYQSIYQFFKQLINLSIKRYIY